MINESFKKTILYNFLRETIEDMQEGDKNIEYNIDKSIAKILDDDYLWDNFYNNISADLVKEEEV